MAVEFHSVRGYGPFAKRERTLRSQGFTLVELLVSTAIMLVVMLVLLQVISGMTNIWRTSTGTISSFQNARAAFTTLTRTIARATLKTYIDYVDANGQPITNTNVNTAGAYSQITAFSRSSELQFMCGPTTQMTSTAIPTVSAITFPGDAIFFQAPLGVVNTSTEKFLQRSLNTVGFYVGYHNSITAGGLPTWLSTALGVSAGTLQPGTTPKYRLMEFIQPTENLAVYSSTQTPATGVVGPTAYNSSMLYIPRAITATTTANTLPGTVGNFYQITTLADNVTLLIIRPRLEPPDEAIVAPIVSATYGPTTANSIISPAYNYDSRAWWGGATSKNPPATQTPSTTRITSMAYARLMRNQLPPILDVAMVAVDGNSVVRFGTPAVPPTQLQVSATGYSGTTPNKGLTYATQVVASPVPFSRSVNMDVDLNNYGLSLSDNGIRYRIFRSSVQVDGAAWVNN